MITGIVVALPEELVTLTPKKIGKGVVEPLTDKILVINSGAGAENARSAAELLVKEGAGNLVSWGCAAGLDVSFRPGDLVLASACVASDRENVGLDDPQRLLALKKELSQLLSAPVHLGKLAESKSIVATSQAKCQVAQSSDVIALDMESAAVARVAQAYNLPFLAIRAIADPLEMNLPAAVSYALNDRGDVVMLKLLNHLLWHPTELYGLIKLGLHFHAAKKTLKRVAGNIEAIARLDSSNTVTS